MGQATRTTTLPLDLSKRSQGGTNTGKRACLQATVEVLNAARAFYVAFFLAHPDKLAERVTYFSDEAANLARQPEQVGPRPHVLRRGMHRLRDVLGLDTEVQQLLHGCGLVEVAQPFALDVLNSSCLQTTSHHWVADTTNAFDLDFHDIPFL